MKFCLGEESLWRQEVVTVNSLFTCSAASLLALGLRKVLARLKNANANNDRMLKQREEAVIQSLINHHSPMHKLCQEYDKRIVGNDCLIFVSFE
jgi:hypothetical protein